MSVALAPSSTIVPAEFRGRARVFRDAIAGEDRATGELISSLDGPIRKRIERGHAVPRRDVLAGVARNWRTRMPLLSRLAVEIDLTKRGKVLIIRELRLSGSEYLDATWNEAERGLAVIMVGLDAAPLRYEFSAHTLCHIGAHALGRRMERGRDGSNDAIKRDLQLLGQAHRDLADGENGSDFSVAVPGGVWVGNVALMRNRRGTFNRALAVRTFLADGT